MLWLLAVAPPVSSLPCENIQFLSFCYIFRSYVAGWKLVADLLFYKEKVYSELELMKRIVGDWDIEFVNNSRLVIGTAWVK